MYHYQLTLDLVVCVLYNQSLSHGVLHVLIFLIFVSLSSRIKLKQLYGLNGDNSFPASDIISTR